eukprot:SAG31_NODE_36757_length_310_cov_1.222749_1_plen_31_part_01
MDPVVERRMYNYVVFLHYRKLLHLTVQLISC